MFGGKLEEGKELDEKVNSVKWVIRVIERKMEVDLSYINAENVIVNKDVWDGMCLLNVVVDLLSVIKEEGKDEEGEGMNDNDIVNDNSGDIVINDKALTDVEDEGEYGFVKTKLLTEANNIVVKSKKNKKKHKQKQSSDNINVNTNILNDKNNNNTNILNDGVNTNIINANNSNNNLLSSHIPNQQNSVNDNNNNININNNQNNANNNNNNNTTSNDEESSSSSQNEPQLPYFIYFPLSKQDLLKEINSITKQIYSPSEYSSLSNNLTFSKSLSSLTSLISSYYSSLTNLPPISITREFLYTNITEIELIIKQFFLPKSIDHRFNPYMQAASIIINNPHFIEQLSHKQSSLLSNHLQLKHNNYLTTQQLSDTQLLQLKNNFVNTLHLKYDYIYNKLKQQENINTLNKSKNIYKVNLLEKDVKQITKRLLSQEQFNKYKRVKLSNNNKNKHL